MVCAGVLVAAAGCATHTGQARPEGAAAANATTSADSLAQTRWELTSWVDALGNPRNLAHGDNGEPISLTFLADGKRYVAQGFAGCNRYSATYKLEAGKLTITAPASTRMACPDPRRAQLEADYLRALADIRSFTLDASGAPRHLTFNVASGDVLDFTRRKDPPTP
ncbi:META domain protein [Bordetella holmesii 70147]|nr:META domain protein [Bordetella holmesii 70147]